MKSLATAFALLLPVVVTATQAFISQTVLDNFNPPRPSWHSKHIAFQEDPAQGHIAVITIPPRARAVGIPLVLGDWAPKAHTFDEMRFDYTISNPGVWFGCKIIDKPLADGYQATWQLKVPQDADRRWHLGAVNIQQPMHRWGNAPTSHRSIHLRVDNPTPDPVVVKIANLRYVRKNIILTLAPAAITWQDARHGQIRFNIQNRLDTPVTIPYQVQATLPEITFAQPQGSFQLPAQATSSFTCTFETTQQLPTLKAMNITVNLLDEQGNVAESSSGETATPMPELPSPALFCHAAQRDNILQRLVTLEHARKWWQTFQKQADGLLDTPITYPDRGSQWWHWYSCKKCGSSLKTKTKTLHVCPTCKAEYTGYPYDDVVLSADHDRLASNALNLGVAYFITRDKRYADKARDILLGYAERYLNYPLHDIHGRPTRGGGHVHPQTLDEAIWLISIVRAIDAIRDALSDEDFNTLGEKMVLPAAYHIKDHSWGIHNICCWHASAYGLAGLLYRRPDLAQPAIFGPKGFIQQIEQGVTSDGQWYERAWGYHFYTTSALEPLAIALKLNDITPIPDKFKLLFDGPLKFLTPTSELPAFHDTPRVRFNPWSNASHYELSYAFWGDPAHGAIIAQTNRRNMTAALFGKDTIATATNLPASENYEETGITVLRSQSNVGTPTEMPPNYIALDYGEHGGGHGHPDKLNFVLWAQGILLAEDPGCIAYGNPAHQGWYRQTVSHNTLVVDGKSQNEATGRCLAFATTDNATIVAADAGPIYDDLTAGRALALVGDTLLDLLWAKDKNGKPRRLEYVFHSRGKRTDAPLASQQPCQPPQGDGYSWAKDWQSTPHDKTWNATWQHQHVTLKLAHASSAPGTLFSASGQGNPPTVHFNLVLNQVTAPQAQFASAFSFAKDNADYAPSVQLLDAGEHTAALKAVINDETYLFLVSTDGTKRQLVAAGASCNAKAALFKLHGQQLQLILADAN